MKIGKKEREKKKMDKMIKIQAILASQRHNK